MRLTSTTRKLFGMVALGAACASAIAIPASAQEPVQVDYAAGSTGSALDLSVFGETMTIGQTESGLDSTLAAVAKGIGIATPAFEGGVSSARVTGEGTEGSPEEVCEFGLADVPGLSIELACSSSVASVVDGLPSSLATGRVGTITVNPVQPLLDTPLAEVVAPVEDGVDQLLDGLRPITSEVDAATGLGVEDTLDDLFGALFDGADLVSIELGTAVTTSSVTPNLVGTKCTSAGGRIDILDQPALAEGVDPDPVMTILIGDSGAAVDVDTITGVATPTVNPAIVTVIVPSMGVNEPIGPGQTIEIPLPEPIGTSTIRVADGVTGVDEAGQTFARADAVFLDLLNGEAMMGGIELGLASCTAVGGAVITQIPTTTTTPDAPPALPRTGGGTPSSLALFGTLGLAGLGFALLRRTAPSVV